jgi:AAA domain, putative AbiEii toxin, Type IV TA system/AAA domain
MLKSFQAHNFRCFKKVDIADLRWVNLVVGKNAAGKTALLEAIRLGLTGTPQVLFQMNQLRGIQAFFPQPLTRELFEAQWNMYFFNFDASKPILTECIDSDGKKATLKVAYDPKKTVTVTQMPPGAVSLAPTIIPLTFDRNNFSGNHSILHATVQPQTGGLSLENGPELGTVSEFYSWQINPQQTAQWFSQVSVQKREREILDPVNQMYGSLIKNLTVLSPGQFASVFADIPYLSERLPLSLVSAGINKFVSVLSAILTRARGVVLIDEIENGFYYDTFPLLWKAILSLAKSCQTQIFVSSHSLECIRAVLPLLKDNEADFMLLRAEREDGSSGITPVSGDFFEAALEQNFEVR